MRHFDSDGVVLPEAADLGEMVIKVRGRREGRRAQGSLHDHV